MEKMRIGKDAYMGLPDNFGGVNHRQWEHQVLAIQDTCWNQCFFK